VDVDKLDKKFYNIGNRINIGKRPDKNIVEFMVMEVPRQVCQWEALPIEQVRDCVEGAYTFINFEELEYVRTLAQPFGYTVEYLAK